MTATPGAPLGIVVVSGESMSPTLKPGDRLLVGYGRVPRPGDLVVVELGGSRPLGVKRATFRLGDGWWVERDNATAGVDSWTVGAIAATEVRGVVLARLAPGPAWLRAPRPGAGGGAATGARLWRRWLG